MKRTDLLDALKLAAPALGDDGAALPALSHFCFEDEQFYAFNDVVAVIVGYPTGLQFGLHGATLLGVLVASRADDIEFKVKGAVVTITGAGRIELPVLNAEDFVFALPDEEPIMSAVLGTDIRNAIEMCLISVAEDSLRPEFNGVTLRIGKGGTVLFSTDNSTLTRAEPKGAKVPPRKESALVLPKVAADLILKLLPADGAVKMHIGEKLAIVEFGGKPEVTLITKLLGTPSTKLDDVFKKHAGGEACALPEGLAAEIAKARVLTSHDSLKECTLVAEKGTLTVSVDATLGKMKSVLKLADKKLEGQVCVNPDFVARVLPYVSMMQLNTDRSLVLSAEGLNHIIAAVPKQASVAESVPTRKAAANMQTGEVTNVDEDDIPF